MTHALGDFVADTSRGDVLARGVAWGAVGGALTGALTVTPLVVSNGPPEALLVYPPLTALCGALVGMLVGLIAAAALLSAQPDSAAWARVVGAAASALAGGWIAFPVSPLVGFWHLLLTTACGAWLGPRVSARPSGAAAATGTASPGSSHAPGR